MTDKPFKVREHYKDRPVSFLYLDKGRTVIKGEPDREDYHVRIQQGEDIVLLETKDIDKVILALQRAKNYVITSHKENAPVE